MRRDLAHCPSFTICSMSAFEKNSSPYVYIMKRIANRVEISVWCCRIIQWNGQKYLIVFKFIYRLGFIQCHWLTLVAADPSPLVNINKHLLYAWLCYSRTVGTLRFWVCLIVAFVSWRWSRRQASTPNTSICSGASGKHCSLQTHILQKRSNITFFFNWHA